VFDGRKRSAARRAPDIELYDHACELVEATAAIRRAVAEPDSTDAVPALLGCVETALRDLAFVADGLDRATDANGATMTGEHRARAAHGHRDLHVALKDAAIAARVAQALAARASVAN
jgi:hypothetical protein